MSMEINLTLEDVLLPQREGYRKLVARTLHSLSSVTSAENKAHHL